ncbi:hypothetical protein [Dyella sp. C11]|uniref:hypothetical protein n=1 Tax=Dyella sp. C11 TaxID=2126991 RepID=UPI001E51503A|nr:hypothetical protein [Dyella sp. C11]
MDAGLRRGPVTRRWYLAFGMGLSLAGCASAPSPGVPHPMTEGDTSYRAVPSGDMAHYQLALGQISTGAVPWHHPAPIYPPALLDQRLPAHEVQAQLIVDEQGKVSEIRMPDEAQADPQARQFDAAVRAAAMQWTFEPLRISQWASDANGNTHEVSTEARPFSLDYVFLFTWKDGKPVTDASASR